MCIAVWYTVPQNETRADGLKFVLAFNRDEFYSRKTAVLHRWLDYEICGGRAMHERRVEIGDNGTWLGFDSKNKRVAFLTNIMMARVDLGVAIRQGKSRGM